MQVRHVNVLGADAPYWTKLYKLEWKPLEREVLALIDVLGQCTAWSLIHFSGRRGNEWSQRNLTIKTKLIL